MGKLFVYCILVLVLVLSLPNTIFGHLIEETCMKLSATNPTIKQDFCVTSLHAAPNSGAATCEVDLGLVLIELLLQSVTDAQARAKELVGDPSLAPDVKVAVQDCLDSYSDAITTTEEAVAEYKARSYRGANVMVSAVLDCANSCRDVCGGDEGSSSPLEPNNENVDQLSALVLSLTNVVKV